MEAFQRNPFCPVNADDGIADYVSFKTTLINGVKSFVRGPTNCSKVCYCSKVVLSGYSTPVNNNDVKASMQKIGICEVLCPRIASIISPTMYDKNDRVRRINCGQIDRFSEI